MRQLMDDVHLWNTAITNNGKDTGIDIVARNLYNPQEKNTAEDSFWAIQCKNWDHELSYKNIATFIASTATDSRYSGFILSTVGSYSKEITNKFDELNHQNNKSALIITPESMEKSSLDWNDFFHDRPAHKVTFDLRPHQRDAVDGITTAFEKGDRCRAIMACGTGKTLTSLRLAEQQCKTGGLVLFAAPSIALVSQSLREWSNQTRVPFRSLVVCSDTKASRTATSEDSLNVLSDLNFPATTNAEQLVKNYEYLTQSQPENTMLVIFTTYQSMGVIETAQSTHRLPDFDLCICDEAHRTTGVGVSSEEASAFQIVLHDDKVHVRKRVFMTATQRIYDTKVQEKARESNYVIASMDDESTYGPVAYELKFDEAVEKGLLCDYRVLVLAISQNAIPASLQRTIANEEGLELDDAAKIIGVYKSLAFHGTTTFQSDNTSDDEVPNFLTIHALDKDHDPHQDDDHAAVEPLHRAVGFCSTIRSSQDIDKYFEEVINEYLHENKQDTANPLHCSLQHIDGGMNTSLRTERLDWLAADTDPHECRILTNARCLSEGVDVPSLDAVIFFSAKKSKIDVIQAVGRVMRSFTNPHTGEKKQLGYIILPIFVPEGISPEEALSNSQSFDVVWEVLQALRSHDERIEAYINSLPYRLKERQEQRNHRIGQAEKTSDSTNTSSSTTSQHSHQGQFDLDTDLAEAIYVKTVERCGNKIYWDEWAEDIAAIAELHIADITRLVNHNDKVHDTFTGFVTELQKILNPGITQDDAIEMVAQHMVTIPIFDALFTTSDNQQATQAFETGNPITGALNRIIQTLNEAGVGVDDSKNVHQQNIQSLYQSVQRRATVARTGRGRQELIKDLYENFFSKAFKATAEKLGIVYTPSEIIDYILYFTNMLLQREFGKGLKDKGIHILDPFAGTGSFLAQLISKPDLIPIEELDHKYLNELHSNEILLLSYYIMTINIEQAWKQRSDVGVYIPFPGAILLDTFQAGELMYQHADQTNNNQGELFPEVNQYFYMNAERAQKQNKQDITVILGNPPYSAGQKNANDNNQNEHYPLLEQRIRDTYSAQTSMTNKNALMDSYIKAFRWASDRIGHQGIISFVTNAGWLKSQVGQGIRRCFSKEFNSIYVYDLRGNLRLGDKVAGHKEGGNPFNVRVPICIVTLVKNPQSEQHGVIHYHDVGECRTRLEKLQLVEEAAHSEPEWSVLSEDQYGDWLNHRHDGWNHLAPLGVWQGNKKTALGLFSIWSSGLKTSRDVWVSNYSKAAIQNHVSSMMYYYNTALQKYVDAFQSPDAYIHLDATRISWSRGLDIEFKRGQQLTYHPDYIVTTMYRPFSQRHIYYDRSVNEMIYQQEKLFPLIEQGKVAQNTVITVPGKGNSRFSTFISNTLPDLHLISIGAQCFPLYWYEKKNDSTDLSQNELPLDNDDTTKDYVTSLYVRHDAITDRALDAFRHLYPQAFPHRKEEEGGVELTKEDIFYYVYGILHSPQYREEFQSNLEKDLPRIPLVTDFRVFSERGRQLATLHLTYENAEIYSTIAFNGVNDGENPGPVSKMKWGKVTDPTTHKKVNDYTRLIYNDHVTITGIPADAQNYVVNGRSPIDWIIDQYQVKVDKASGIVNDPNDWKPENPRYIMELVGRCATVAVRTNKIVNTLPRYTEIQLTDDWPVEWLQPVQK